jgi:alpha-tubulin suppressor-like RCC1 family protein
MGEQFTIVLSQRGYVYTWGMNDKGQLGIGNQTPVFEPVQVSQIGPTSKHSIEPITKVSCGLKHCIVMTKNCELYAWGSNLQC